MALPHRRKVQFLLWLFIPCWLAPAVVRADEPVVVMTYNIRYDSGAKTLPERETPWLNGDGPHRRDWVLGVIVQADADLLGLQEAQPHQFEAVANRLEGYTAYSVGREDSQQGGEQCSIFFRTERFEQLDQGTFWLCATPTKPGSRHPDAKCPRIASWVRLKDRKNGDRELVFLNTHWDNAGQPARQYAAEAIADRLVGMEAEHTIVTGDLNASANSPEVARLLGDKRLPLVDAYRKMHPEVDEQEATFNRFVGRTKGKRIDFVLTAPTWKPTRAEILRPKVDGKDPSDHYPVVVELAPVAWPPRP